MRHLWALVLLVGTARWLPVEPIVVNHLPREVSAYRLWRCTGTCPPNRTARWVVVSTYLPSACVDGQCSGTVRLRVDRPLTVFYAMTAVVGPRGSDQTGLGNVKAVRVRP